MMGTNKLCFCKGNCTSPIYWKPLRVNKIVDESKTRKYDGQWIGAHLYQLRIRFNLFGLARDLLKGFL